MSGRMPCAILTGYLGAGKTTLLNNILSAPGGRRYGVMVNEFGEIGIDQDLIVRADDRVVELSNGCICCSARGDIAENIGRLMLRRDDFDALLIETSGLADPTPIAQAFFVDPDLAEMISLDTVLAVADARWVLRRLEDAPETACQIAFADTILLNKIDLATGDELDAIEARLRDINRHARIVRTLRSSLDGIEMFDGSRAGWGRFPVAQAAAVSPSGRHDDAVRSVSLSLDGELDPERFMCWLTGMLRERGTGILRTKGILAMAGEPCRFVVQGVHAMLEGRFADAWQPGEARRSRLVLIGRGLDEAALRAAFLACASAQKRRGE